MKSEDLLAKAIGAKVAGGEAQEEVQQPAVEAQPEATPEVPVEEPKAEENKIEESSSLTAESSETEVSTPVDFEQLLRERSEGKFNSMEDIFKALEERPKEESISYANETIEQLDKLAREGWSLEEYMSVYSKNFDDLSDDQVIKEYMKFNEKDLTKEEIDFLYQSEYGYDADEDMDSDVKLKQIKTKREAAKARQELKSFQQKYQPKQKQQATNNEEQLKAVQQRWEQQLSNASINELVSGDAFKYQVSDEALGKVKSELKDLNNYFGKYVNPDGSENVSKLIEDQLKIQLFDQAISAAFTMAKSQGREEVVSNRDNVTAPKESRPAGPKNMQAQLLEQAKQKGFF